MASKVLVANIGLRLLGQRRISSFTESGSPISEQEFDEVLDEVLAEHPWNAAKKRASLNLLTTAPLYGFAYAYQLPGDLIRVLSIDSAGQSSTLTVSGVTQTTSRETTWRVEGRTLLCDVTPVEALYIAHVDDMNVLPAYLRNLVGTKIAAYYAQTLNQSATMAQLMEQEYQRKLSQARFNNAQEGVPADLSPSDWTLARL